MGWAGSAPTSAASCGSWSPLAANQDDQISQLRSRLQAVEGEDSRSKAYSTAVASVAFDAILLLDEDLKIVSLNQAAARLVMASSAVDRPLPEVVDSDELCDLAALALRESESLDQQLVIGES